MQKILTAHRKSLTLLVAAGFMLSLLATAMVSLTISGSASAAAFEVSRVQYGFDEGKTAQVTLGDAPEDGNLLVAIAATRKGVAVADQTISGDGWKVGVARNTQLTNPNARRTLAVWYKVAGDSEPATISVSSTESVKLLVQEFSTPAPGPWMLLGAASNDNGDAVNATSLSSGATASISGSQMWVTALGIRNTSDVFSFDTWTPPVGNTLNSIGNNNAPTLNSGYGLGVGTFNAESTASWDGNNTGASAAILVFQVPDMCYLPAQAGRTIVDMTPYEFIRADKTQTDAEHGPFKVDLKAGTYKVILHSYDDHSGEKRGQVQPEESWYLQLWNSDVVNFQNTSPISDLPDKQDFITEVVDEELVIKQDVALVQAFHAAYQDENPNSIYPICVAFDKVTEDEGEVEGETDQVVAPTGSVNAGVGSEVVNAAAFLGVLVSLAATGYGVYRFSRARA